ncbi:MAG: HAD family phosphatase [Patescibacteria group bacterium]
MVKAIIFDLNGVFIKSPVLSERFAKDFRIKNLVFLPALKKILNKVRLPKAGPAYEYWRPYFKKWKVDLTRDEFYKYWFGAEKPVSEMISLAEKLKQKGLKIYILSNNFRERSNYYGENFPFLKIFNKVYYSWQTGFRKPEKEAYLDLLRKNNLKPEECLFFDNSPKNVKTSKSLGIISYIFKNKKQVENISGLHVKK